MEISETDTPNISSDTVIFILTIGVWSNYKKVNSGLIQTDADRSLLKVSKQLVDSAEYKAAQQCGRDIREFVRHLSVPCTLFRGGFHLLRLQVLEDVIHGVEQRTPIFYQLADSFRDVYEERSRQGQQRLKSLGSQDDYLTADEVRKRFYITTQIRTIGVPKTLTRLSAKLYREEQHKLQEYWQEVGQEIRQGLYAALNKIVQSLAGKLRPDVDGKRKKVSDDQVAKLVEFTQNLANVDPTKSHDLEALAKQVKNVLSGVSDADSINSSEVVSARILSELDQMIPVLDAAIIKQPRRKVWTPEEEAQEA